MGIHGCSNIQRFWAKTSASIHKPMRFMSYYRFSQIKRYFHVAPPTKDPLPPSQWFMKLSPLFEYLRKQFKLYCIPSQNVSIDEEMCQFTGRSVHTIKMKNKPISEGYKLFTLCDRGYTWDFLFTSCTSGMLNSFI